jgi:hypothetical protein
MMIPQGSNNLEQIYENSGSISTWQLALLTMSINFWHTKDMEMEELRLTQHFIYVISSYCIFFVSELILFLHT